MNQRYYMTQHGNYSLPVLQLRYRTQHDGLLTDEPYDHHQHHRVKLLINTRLQFEGFPITGPGVGCAWQEAVKQPAIILLVEVGPFGTLAHPDNVVYDGGVELPLKPNSTNILRYTSLGHGIVQCTYEMMDLK